MRTVLRLVGIACMTVVVAGLVSWLVGVPVLLPLVPGSFVLGIVLLSLATILDRLTHLEFLIQSSHAGATDRIQTEAGHFERLGNVEGEAMCLGCRKIAPKASLYYDKAMDVYYHLECLGRDYKK